MRKQRLDVTLHEVGVTRAPPGTVHALALGIGALARRALRRRFPAANRRGKLARGLVDY